ncbi:MAG: zinc ribbon domain-containing protein [Terriglobales bacterium]
MSLLSGSLCASFKDVEHSCQQCGTTVEDGRPFCPQCRAPQIHVQVAIPDAGAAAGSNHEADKISPEIVQAGHFDRTDFARPRAIAGRTMDRGIAVRAALKAGALGVFIAIIPLLGIVLTGALAVFFYRRENGLVLPAALGSRIGGAAGVVAFAINTLLFAIRIFVFHAQKEYIDFLTQIAQKTGVNAADTDFQTIIHSMLTPSGMAFIFFFGMIFVVVLAAAGGAIASWFMQPRNTRP